jgi:signal transduction histidine kinase
MIPTKTSTYFPLIIGIFILAIISHQILQDYKSFSGNNATVDKIQAKINDTLNIHRKKGTFKYEIFISRPPTDSIINIDFVNVDDVIFSSQNNENINPVEPKKFQYRLNRTGSEIHRVFSIPGQTTMLQLEFETSFFKDNGSIPFVWITTKTRFENAKKEFLFKDTNTSLLIAFMFGMFFLQLAYSFTMAISLRKLEYWYYFAFIFEYLRLNLVFFQYQFDWDFSFFLSPNSVLLQTCIMFFFYVRFARNFFGTIEDSKIIEYFSLLCCLFYFFMPNQFCRSLYQEYALPLLYLFSLRMFYVILKLKSPIKLYFLIGSLLLLLSAIISRLLISSGYLAKYDHYTIRMFTYPIDFLLLNLALNKKRKIEIEEIKKSQRQDRIRIAKDLHDEVGSSIGSIPLFVQSLKSMIDAKNNEIQIGLNHINKIAENAGIGLRDAVWTIDSRKEYLQDLQIHINEYMYPLINGGVQYKIEADLPRQKISPTFKRNVWLLLKESLNNALKYSNATEITIRLVVENGQLVGSIQDNGVGFELNSIPQKGNGIDNMNSRVRDLYGQIDISSKNGQGTIVFFTIPLERND